MELGIILTGGGMRVAEMCAIAARAERSGFTMMALAEVHHSGWVPLTAMAAATERIRLAPYVLNAYGRSPLLTGMSAVDFNDFCGGRLILGVGGGNRIVNEQWQGIEHTRVLTKMREYVTLMQRIARTGTGERLVYEGEVHRMDWTPAVDPTQPAFPVYLAAVFPRMLRVAGRVADGVAGGATLSADYLREVVQPLVAQAAADADRDPHTIAWAAAQIVAVDADRERARLAARDALCHLYAPLPHPYYEYTMREQGFGAVADTLLQAMPAGRVGAAREAITDECLDSLAIAGTVDECRARFAAYEGVVDDLLLLNAMPPDAGSVVAAYDALMTLPGTRAR